MNDQGNLEAAIRVRTTERGLPVELALTAEALALPPERLAQEILLRCQANAHHLQVLRRERLSADGIESAVADALKLSTSAQLAEVRARLDGDEDEDEPPTTWLRRR